jgi:hypothetical protein
MGTIEDIRQVIQDFLAPQLATQAEQMAEIRRSFERLEKQLQTLGADLKEMRVDVKRDILQVTDYARLLERLARVEARQDTQQAQ